MIFKPKENEIRPNIEEKNQKMLWCPFAKIMDQKMKTRGKYQEKYPEGAVIHYTAGGNDPISTINWGREMGYSYMLIDRDGLIYQSSPLDEWGYHAGESSYLGREGVSKYFVGIEMISAGRVLEVSSNKTGVETKYAAWFHYVHGSTAIKKDAVLFERDEIRFSKTESNIRAGNYHKFTVLQEESLISLLLWLKSNNQAVFSFNNVVGHDEVSPGRKQDPGGSLSMTMPNLRRRLDAIYSGTILP